MRSGRNGKWESSLVQSNGGGPNGYSSSEDDEMTRLKPSSGNTGTSTSGGSSSGHNHQHHRRSGRPSGYNRNQQHHPNPHSNSEGATSPNESDNTYAEASLLQQTTLVGQQRPIRYGQYHPSFLLLFTR